MDLPNDEIGISDILSWRECPRRMTAGMKRHTGDEWPEMTSDTNAYGSAIHDAISHMEEHDCTRDEAVQAAFKKWRRFLDPDSVQQMREDLDLYVERDPVAGCRTMLNEGEIRVPLMQYGNRTIYFRARIDRLYQRVNDPTRFIHVDYKSSAWRKTEAEVDDDLQFWAYNWAIHEFFPECEALIQHYDQLRYGIVNTSKTELQRQQIKDWLQLAVIAIIEDDGVGQDGLGLPTWNEWCPWCQIKMDCPVVQDEMTDFATATIRALAPSVPVLKADGSPGKRTEMVLDIDLLNEYVELLPRVGTARKTLEDFETRVRDALKMMSAANRQALGYRIREATKKTYTATDLAAIHDLVGEEFYSLVGLTASSLDRFYGKDDPVREMIEEHVTTEVGATQVIKE